MARTSTLALTSVTLPYLVQIANLGAEKAIAADPALEKGLSTIRAHLVSQPVASAIGLPYVPAEQVLR